MPAAETPDLSARAEHLARHILDMVQRHPGAALPADHLQELVELEGPTSPSGTQELLRSLAGGESPLHLLVPRKRRWPGLSPRPWVLARTAGSRSAGHPILDGLRETLRRLGQGVDPDSNLQMARWERYIIEEAEVHRAVGRRLRRRDRGMRRSTTLPRGPRK
ncbi:hypothetical protein BH23GEM11_BH23GEM11_03420 [soil metagenome]